MNEETLFHLVLDKPAEERAAFLATACANDKSLRGRIEVLLRAHENPGSFLAGQAVEPSTATFASADFPTPAPSLIEAIGTQLGPYKLLQMIGEGGMGAVYLAEQSQPVRRHVALKIVKPGMDTKAVLARFEAERQALA